MQEVDGNAGEDPRVASQPYDGPECSCSRLYLSNTFCVVQNVRYSRNSKKMPLFIINNIKIDIGERIFTIELTRGIVVDRPS